MLRTLTTPAGSRVGIVIAAVLLSGTAVAQLPDWVDYPVTNPLRSFEEAHILVVQDAAAVHVFSTYTRRWAAIATTSPSAQFTGYDDHAIVEDGATFYGFAVRYGTFEPLHTTSPAPYLASLAASSYLSVVVDGNDFHAFSPFTGAWTTLRTTAPGPISAAKMAAVFSDGATVYGYSPVFGQFVPLQASMPITAASAGGYSCYATDGSAHYCFSGVRNRWTTMPSAANAQVTVGAGRHGYVILGEGVNVDLFSGITGESMRVVCSQAPSITRAEQTVVLQDGNDTHVWSTITNTVGTLTTAQPPSVTVMHYFAAIVDGVDLHVFSAPKGAFAPVLRGNWTPSYSDSVALAIDPTGVNMAYSALSNRWVAGPTGFFGPLLTQNGVILEDMAGALHGFSARTSAWASATAAGAIDTHVSHGSSFCARAGNDLYAYNVRYGRWAHTRTTTPARLTTKRETVLADYGAEAQAYCTWTDRWARVQLSSPAANVLVSDDSALVQDSGGLHGFGGSCQVSTLGLYPEWWRFMSRGTRCPLYVAGEPGAGAVVVLGFDTTSVTIPGISGRLGVDPSTALLVTGVVPAQGMWVLPTNIPNVRALAGLTLQTQALIVPPGGAYFSAVFPTTLL
ncbi:MAG: hypothetical protein R3F56_25015 [Planctomycetota bacterium]